MEVSTKRRVEARGWGRREQASESAWKKERRKERMETDLLLGTLSAACLLGRLLPGHLRLHALQDVQVRAQHAGRAEGEEGG